MCYLRFGFQVSRMPRKDLVQYTKGTRRAPWTDEGNRHARQLGTGYTKNKRDSGLEVSAMKGQIRGLLFTVLLVATIFVIGGCARPTTPSEGEVTRPSAEKPISGGTVIFARAGDSVGLDPAIVVEGESTKVCDNLYDGLVRYKSGSTEIEPALAENWETSSDGLTWTFHLRAGVNFHDGTLCDANAVVFSFDRQANPQHPAHKFGGEFAYWKAMGVGGIIKDVKAIDDSTVQITLKRRYAPLLSILAMNFLSVVSPDAVNEYKDEYFKHPVGTGPFKFVEWVKGDHITLERNAEYWGGAPYLEKVIFRVVPEETTRFLSLRDGSADLMEGLSPKTVTSAQGNSALRVYEAPGMNVAYVAINCKHKPLDDLRVRTALNLGVDRDGLVRSLYQNLAVAAKNPLPPSLWGYNDQVPDLKRDVAKARQLLVEAGYGQGLKVSLWAMGSGRPYMTEPGKVAEFLQANWREIGVEAKIQSIEIGTYLAKLQKGEHELALAGWIADNGDPDNFLYGLFDPNSMGSTSYLSYVNQNLHQVLIQAQQETDQTKRSELYRFAQDTIAKDLPYIPLVHAKNIACSRAVVHGYQLQPTGKQLLHKVWKAVATTARPA